MKIMALNKLYYQPRSNFAAAIMTNFRNFIQNKTVLLLLDVKRTIMKQRTHILVTCKAIL